MNSALGHAEEQKRITAHKDGQTAAKVTDKMEQHCGN